MAVALYDVSELQCTSNPPQYIPERGIVNDSSCTSPATNAKSIAVSAEVAGVKARSDKIWQGRSGITLNGGSEMNALSTDRGGSSLKELSSLSASSATELKRSAISQACQAKDIDKLIRLADSKGGLVDDSLRRAACKDSHSSTT